jgi:hypothetical protein
MARGEVDRYLWNELKSGDAITTGLADTVIKWDDRIK